MSSPSEPRLASRVVAVVVAESGVPLTETLDAVSAQVYEAVTPVIVGGDKDVREATRILDVPWHASFATYLAGVDPEVHYLWFLQAGVIPDPLALDALVGEAERNDASVVGSKLISATEERTLISVGMTTDVFGVDATTFVDTELDQGQYDVVRDVAAVRLVSALVRRDLARGIGVGEGAITNEGTSLAFCNRARLAGARIVIAPSSIVAVPADAPKSDMWRVEADRIRSMITSYSLVTLAWTLPARVLIGLLEGVTTLFARPWTGLATVKAWVWNAGHIVESLRQRRTTMSVRLAGLGDTELFRFQVSGSIAFRGIGSRLMDRLRSRIIDRGGFDIETLAGELRQPAFVAAGLGVAFVALVTRGIISGTTAAAGFNAPLPVGGDLFGAYAGGWNPAGFGSGDPLPPIVGLFGVADKVLPFSSEFAYMVVLVGAVAAAVWGVGRLAKLWGIGAVAGALGGVGYIAGPAAVELADGGLVASIVGLGVLPWAVLAVLRPVPRGLRSRVGWFAQIGATSGLLMFAEPALTLALVGVLAVWLVVAARGWTPLIGTVPALIGIAIGAVAVLPWVLTIDDPQEWLRQGTYFWDISPLVGFGLIAVVVGGIVGATDRLRDVAAWAGIIAAAGVLASRMDVGTPIGVSGVAMTALGLAIAAAVAIDAIGTEHSGGIRIGVIVVGVGMIALAGSVAVSVLGGRVGLPSAELANSIGFISRSQPENTSARILIIGSADAIPGDVREVRGATYRVIPASGMKLWDLWQGAPSTADVALDRILQDMIDGNEFRGGERLSRMGIGWAVVLDESPLEAVLRSQLDVDSVGAGVSVAFTMPETQGAVVSNAEPAWVSNGTGYTGPATDGPVFLASNPHSFWDPDGWRQQVWGNSVDGRTGEIVFTARALVRQRAFGALLGMGVLIGLAVWGRERYA
ncbi:hypothetical protein BMS3Bbin02_00917 [bacterium BMS3Bbin02]|nr:hypothetical protein BMS3Bbin02_00917 [bacterium BMS3Bbin02]